MIYRRYLIYGRVQGVGFRWFTRQRAQLLGIRGWVRNLPDRCVECLAAGDENRLDAFQSMLKEGPALSRVDRIDVVEEAPQALHSDFQVS